MAFKLRGPGGSGMMGGGGSEHKLMKRMMREHPDVLQNIEFVLTDGYRHDSSIDDCVVLEALRAAINGETPADPRAQGLVEGFTRIRGIRDEKSAVADDVWRDGLLVVLQSVRRHSTPKPGARGYPNFVSQYVR